MAKMVEPQLKLKLIPESELIFGKGAPMQMRDNSLQSREPNQRQAISPRGIRIKLTVKPGFYLYLIASSVAINPS